MSRPHLEDEVFEIADFQIEKPLILYPNQKKGGFSQMSLLQNKYMIVSDLH